MYSSEKHYHNLFKMVFKAYILLLYIFFYFTHTEMSPLAKQMKDQDDMIFFPDESYPVTTASVSTSTMPVLESRHLFQFGSNCGIGESFINGRCRSKFGRF